MADVLILEPNADVRELFSHVVTRMGHDPVLSVGDRLPAAIVLEPASRPHLLRALAVLQRRSDVPVVCVSTDGPNAEVRELQPVAFLEKPFGLKRLQHELETALASSDAPRSRPSSR